MEQGIIFNIQKFSLHDGPGIRTTIFFKGCPLECQWCSNPESQLSHIQVLYDYNKCTHCQTCINKCPHHAITYQNNHILIDQDNCTHCLTCVDSCLSQALSHEGEYKSVHDIVNICLQDKDFYEESGGGITISGGEGMSQPSFLKALVKELKKYDLHIAIETTGYIEEKTFQELAPMFDLLLFDVKHYDSNKHYNGTNTHNELIINNLSWASQNHINILPRIPVIPDFNDSLMDATGLANLLIKLNIKSVQLLPFHQFGEKKYSLLNKEYQFKTKKALHPEELVDYQQIFIDLGLDCFF